jgi:3-deoxy-manno-octulosonate cytidylyltransferase (CMP-KDO synthetase)
MLEFPVLHSAGSATRSPATAVAVIPARFSSTRLPGKPLADIHGRPMIEHVYRRANEATTVSRVIVATDDLRVFEAVRAFGGEVMMTSPHHRTGSERVAEVAASLRDDLIVNVQGDEPLLAPGMIDDAVVACAADPSLVMSTVRSRITDPAEIASPAVVKVVTDRNGRALYFTRAAVPFLRDPGTPATWYKHVGLYVYRREFLLAFAALPPTPLELSESLEQLRALEHGHAIMTVESRHEALGVDTPDDLERVRRLLAAPATT